MGLYDALFESSGLGGYAAMPADLVAQVASVGPVANTAGGGLLSGFGDILGGGWDVFKQGLGVIASPGALNLAKLGLTGMSAYAGSEAMSQAGEQMKLLKAAERRAAAAQEQAGATSAEARAAAQPQIAAAAQLTPAGTAALLGQAPLPPGLEATVEKWTREAKAAAASYYARAGITDSTMMDQLNSWIDSQAVEMRTKLAESLLQSGTAAGSAAATELSTAISGAGTAGASAAGTLPQQQSTALAAALHDANQALYNLLGGMK